MITLEKIVCPIDFSEYSKHALTYAVALATQYQSKLYLIHVVEPIRVPIDLGVGVPGLLEYEGTIVEKAREHLEGLLDLTARATLEVEAHVLRGAAFAEIVRFARDKNVDLIVIATHGLSGIAQLLLGSTAEKVVRKAPCPVLTVKHPEHEFVMP